MLCLKRTYWTYSCQSCCCCYFWCCLCRQQARVRVGGREKDYTTAVNKRPPAALLLLLLALPSPTSLPPFFWLSYFVLSRCLHDTPLWWSKVSYSDPLSSLLASCSSRQRASLPSLSCPLSAWLAYHINSFSCLFFLSFLSIYFLVSVFSVLLSDPEHNKKVKNVDCHWRLKRQSVSHSVIPSVG